MTSPIYPSKTFKNPKDTTRNLAEGIYRIMQGETDNTSTITLTPNSATTVLQEGPNRIGQNTKVFLFPTTANAAAEVPTIYQSSLDTVANTVTFTHTNNGLTDRIFNYVIWGK